MRALLIVALLLAGCVTSPSPRARYQVVMTPVVEVEVVDTMTEAERREYEMDLERRKVKYAVREGN